MSPDGSMVFVTGKSYRSATNVDYATIAYDASTGTKLWVERYNGPGHGIDVAMALGVSPDGSMVFVTGQSDASTTYSPDYATIASRPPQATDFGRSTTTARRTVSISPRPWT